MIDLEKILKKNNFDLVLLPPKDFNNTEYFSKIVKSNSLRQKKLNEVLNFRNQKYLEDNAINNYTKDPILDNEDIYWHIILINNKNKIKGSVKALFHNPGIDHYDIFNKFFNNLELNQKKYYQNCLAQYLRYAKNESKRILEIGGFSVEKKKTNTSAMLILICSCWSISRLISNSLGLAVVTKKHNFSKILCKLGGFKLFYNGDVLQPFFDVNHNSEVEIIGFETWLNNERIESLVEDLKNYFCTNSTLIIN